MNNLNQQFKIILVLSVVILLGIAVGLAVSFVAKGDSLSPSECIQVCDLQAEQNLKYPRLNFDGQPYQFNVKSCVKKCISEGL